MDKPQELLEKWNSLMPFTAEDKERLYRKFAVEYRLTVFFTHFAVRISSFDIFKSKIFPRYAANRETAELKRIDGSIKMIRHEALMRDKPLTEEFILRLHRCIMGKDRIVVSFRHSKLIHIRKIHAGIYKTRMTHIRLSDNQKIKLSPPETVPSLINALLKSYNGFEHDKSISPIGLAAFLSLNFVFIHPFEDGNGRISRLLTDYILLRHGYPMINIDMKSRSDYLIAICQSVAESNIQMHSLKQFAGIDHIRPFINFLTHQLENEIVNDMKFLSNKCSDHWWCHGRIVEFTCPETVHLLQIITENPEISVQALSRKLEIKEEDVKKQIEKLIQRNYIVRVGQWNGIWHPAIICTAAIN